MEDEEYTTEPIERKFPTNIPNIAKNAIAQAETHQRLSKALQKIGICSRKEAEKWILSGRVSINGFVCKSPTYMVENQKKLDIKVDGVMLHQKYSKERPRIWAMYKHKQEMMSAMTEDQDWQKSRRHVIDR